MVRVNGARVFAREEEGAGLPVVLLHMAGAGGSAWGPVAGLLGRQAHVLAPDFPGHGQSEAAALPAPGALARDGVKPHLAALAAWTLQWLDACGIERAFLAGHSLGGCVAMTVALGAPRRVAGLGLVCTSADLALPDALRDALHHRYEAFIASFPGAAVARGAARPVFPQADPATVRADFDAVDGFHVLGALPALTVPVAVIAGELDVITPPEHARRLAAALPSARLTLVPGGGHLLPREQPPTVARALADAHAHARAGDGAGRRLIG